MIYSAKILLTEIEMDSIEDLEIREILGTFCKDNELLSFEISMAYEISIGAPYEKQAPIRECVFKLAKMFDEYMKNGFPIASVGEVVATFLALEDAENVFSAFVESLKTSESEKRTLLSIVREVRGGVVGMKDVATGTDIRMSTEEWSEGFTSKEMAHVLYIYFKDFENLEVEVEFTS